MMNWSNTPIIYWTIGVWFVFLIIAFLVYKDAKEKEMNPVLWFILVAIPWIGILFLAIYLVIREEDIETPEDIREVAEAILDKRYASGEITEEEYQRIKKNIKEDKYRWNT